MDNLKRSEEARNNRAFFNRVAVDLNTPIQTDLESLVAALNAHKTSADHDGRYYIKSEVAQFLSYKADKARVFSAGLGLTGGGSLEFDRSFAVDTTASLSWMNTQYFQTILPSLPDTYDLGSSDLLWRKIWGSELSAIVLKEYEQFVMGGMFLVTKQGGGLASGVLAADTQVDFGQAMTAGDFVLFRTAGKVEYMTVGALVNDTTYNVTRDLDGTGANDWPAGSVYAVLGQSGNGRIALDAIERPKLSIITQGNTYNSILEGLRLGELTGWQGAGFTGMGMAIGDYAAGEYLRYSSSDKKLQFVGGDAYFGNGSIVLSDKGIAITQPRDAIKFYDEGTSIAEILSTYINDSDLLFKGLELNSSKVINPKINTGGSFDVDLEGWDGSIGLARVTDIYYSAPASLRLTASSGTDFAWAESASIPIVGGRYYTYSAKVKIASANSAITVLTYLAQYNSSNASIGSEGQISISYSNKDTDWLFVTATFKAYPAAVSAKFKLIVERKGAGSVTAWIDDIVISESSSYAGIQLYSEKIKLNANTVTSLGNFEVNGFTRLNRLSVGIPFDPGDGNIFVLGNITAANITGWQSWTPTQTGWTGLPTGRYWWCRVGDLVTCVVQMYNGTSNANTASLSLPIQARVGPQYRGAWGWAMDNGMQLASAGAWVIASGGTEVSFSKTMVDNLSSWTASGTKRIYAVFQYAAGE